MSKFLRVLSVASLLPPIDILHGNQKDLFLKASLMMLFVLLKIIQEPLHQTPKSFYELNPISFFVLAFYLITVEMCALAILNYDKAFITWFLSTAPIVLWIQNALSFVWLIFSILFMCQHLSESFFDLHTHRLIPYYFKFSPFL